MVIIRLSYTPSSPEAERDWKEREEGGRDGRESGREGGEGGREGERAGIEGSDQISVGIAEVISHCQKQIH